MPAKGPRSDVTRESHDTFWSCFNGLVNENNR